MTQRSFNDFVGLSPSGEQHSHGKSLIKDQQNMKDISVNKSKDTSSTNIHSPMDEIKFQAMCLIKPIMMNNKTKGIKAPSHH